MQNLSTSPSAKMIKDTHAQQKGSDPVGFWSILPPRSDKTIHVKRSPLLSLGTGSEISIGGLLPGDANKSICLCDTNLLTPCEARGEFSEP